MILVNFTNLQNIVIRVPVCCAPASGCALHKAASGPPVVVAEKYTSKVIYLSCKQVFAARENACV